MSRINKALKILISEAFERRRKWTKG